MIPTVTSPARAKDHYTSATKSGSFSEDFASFLLAEEIVAGSTISRAVRACVQTSGRLDRIVVELGILSERDTVRVLAEFLGFMIAHASDFPDAALIHDLLPSVFVCRSGLMPISLSGNHLVVACIDPLDDEPARAVAYLTGMDVEVRVASASDFRSAAQRLYEGGNSELASAAEIAHDEDGDAQDLQRLRDNASEAPVVRFVNKTIGDALDAQASDIHFEPSNDAMEVRFRIDGMLRTARSAPSGLRAAITSRIKIMARLDIAERRLPQDGRLRTTARGAEIDFRISTIPTSKGESVVMRILDRSRVALDFGSLGFGVLEIDMMRRLLAQPNGIVLVTGPTGSGKTTTLYAGLKELHREQVKIFTVEDPIEYQIDGINQVQVQPSVGLNFPHALRSILRQDPDVIMIGEIRDAETARIAVQAALTGHLVLSTLHTNSAASAITRLLDMGIEAFLLASTVRGVVAQRLVRRLCTACSGIGHPSDTEHCGMCQGTGFRGRSTISEILTIDADLQQIVGKRGSDDNLEAAAKAKGMRTMHEAGLAKVASGVTPLGEVLRVTEAA